KGSAKAILDKAAQDFGLTVSSTSNRPAGLQKIAAARIALWDTYGGSMPSGWIRWMMEQYQFDAKVIYAPDIDAGNLRSQYDVIIFVGGAIPAVAADGQRMGGGFGNIDSSSIPAEYRAQLGRITADK